MTIPMTKTYELINLTEKNRVVCQGTYEQCMGVLPYPRLYDDINDIYVFKGHQFVVREMMENEP